MEVPATPITESNVIEVPTPPSITSIATEVVTLVEIVPALVAKMPPIVEKPTLVEKASDVPLVVKNPLAVEVSSKVKTS